MTNKQSRRTKKMEKVGKPERRKRGQRALIEKKKKKETQKESKAKTNLTDHPHFGQNHHFGM